MNAARIRAFLALPAADFPALVALCAFLSMVAVWAMAVTP